uniref:RING-type domain-containing protein n=1 Tax=Prolemur simus TaxID=1328070 RepID=A0A8C9AS15_PROSS
EITSTMNTRICCGSKVNSRQGPPPDMALHTEVIELGESDEVIDLTCESREPVVIDLTHHDSVVISERSRRPRGNTRSLQGQTGSCVVSSDEEELMRDRDVYVTNTSHRNALEEETLSHTLPGYIWCRICMDGYTEIEVTRRHIYSTECGHIFCSQCLCTSFKYTKTCPVCLKKINCRQYHRQTDSVVGFFHVLVQELWVVGIKCSEL